MRDISKFKEGEIATQVITGIKYKVIKYIYGIKGGKRTVTNSKCINLETGKEVIITWNKNRNFS
jgi:hypothetical protein